VNEEYGEKFVQELYTVW